MESVLIHEQGFIYEDIVYRALEYATEDFSFTTSHQTSAFTTSTEIDSTSMLTDTTETTTDMGPTSMLTDTTEISTTPGTTVRQTMQLKKRRKKRSIKKIL